MSLEAGAGRWSRDIRGTKPAGFPQVANWAGMGPLRRPQSDVVQPRAVPRPIGRVNDTWTAPASLKLDRSVRVPGLRCLTLE
jgi:hypothetical protein